MEAGLCIGWSPERETVRGEGRDGGLEGPAGTSDSDCEFGIPDNNS